MLSHLSIKNFALIESLELDLHQGFTVITGETGAGKSILLGALDLILGKRADFGVIRKDSRKCVVEGSFRINKDVKSFFENYDLDFEELTIVRREVSSSGKSRAFVNDTPVTLDVLANLASRLIDVHSQHQNILLNDPAFQLQLLDSFASNDAELENYRRSYREYREIASKIEEMHGRSKSESGDSEYLQFLFDELYNANLKDGEQEELEAELLRLENSGEISAKLSEALQLLDGEQQSVLPALRQASSALSVIGKYDPKISELANRAESSLIELDDIVAELQNSDAGAEFDPAEAERLDQRLSMILSLQRKHQQDSISGLIKSMNELEEKISFISNLEDELKELERQKAENLEQLKQNAEVLHKSRISVVESLQQQIIGILKNLNMAAAGFEIRVLPGQTFSMSGSDKVEFYFTANPGIPAERLSKIASGGEQGRVMLALKAIMAKTQNLPSIIFDEIDTGVSGETAGKIGEILRNMGTLMQVIAISHLPQIASMSTHHYKVQKEVKDNSTTSGIRTLSEEERVQEVARLLSGEKITGAALENARGMLSS